MKRITKLTPLEQQQQPHLAEQQTRQQSSREFASVEETLRYDAAQTRVPPAVAERLRQSINQTPAPARSWWQRFFGASNR